MRNIKYIVLVMFLASSLYGQNIIGQASGDLRYSRTNSEKEYMAGEHTPLEYSGSGTVSGTSSMVFYTQWMQIGVGDGAGNDDNASIQKYNPEYFTLGILLSSPLTSDTASVSDAKIQYALTPTDTLVTATITVKAEDTTAVGEVITGSMTGATAIVTAVIVTRAVGTAGADSIITAYIYPGNIFTTADSVGNNAGSDVTAVTYANTGISVLADSSNIFIDSGYYSHAQYGTWRYLPQKRMDVTVQYALRAFGAAYARLYFACDDTPDTCTVTWKMRAEH